MMYHNSQMNTFYVTIFHMSRPENRTTCDLVPKSILVLHHVISTYTTIMADEMELNLVLQHFKMFSIGF